MGEQRNLTEENVGELKAQLEKMQGSNPDLKYRFWKQWDKDNQQDKVLILTVGLPRSGKSTWALNQGAPIVNRDAIRLALHGQAYIAESEDMITAMEMYMVKSLFLAGHTKVVVDATHLKEKYRKRWESKKWDLQYKEFPATKEACIERAKKDGRQDLIPIIERMAENVEWPNNSD